jgi:hypothetical protein
MGKLKPPLHKLCHQKLAHWNYAIEKSAQPKNVLPLYKMIKPITQTNSRIGICYQN